MAVTMLLALQRSAGNAAVAHLVDGAREPVSDTPEPPGTVAAGARGPAGGVGAGGGGAGGAAGPGGGDRGRPASAALVPPHGHDRGGDAPRPVTVQRGVLGDAADALLATLRQRAAGASAAVRERASAAWTRLRSVGDTVADAVRRRAGAALQLLGDGLARLRQEGAGLVERITAAGRAAGGRLKELLEAGLGGLRERWAAVKDFGRSLVEGLKSRAKAVLDRLKLLGTGLFNNALTAKSCIGPEDVASARAHLAGDGAAGGAEVSGQATSGLGALAGQWGATAAAGQQAEAGLEAQGHAGVEGLHQQADGGVGAVAAGGAALQGQAQAEAGAARQEAQAGIGTLQGDRDTAVGDVEGSGGSALSGLRSLLGPLGSALAGAAEAVLGGVRRAVGDAAGSLRERAGGALARLRELAGSAGRRLEDGVRSLVGRAGELLDGLRRRGAELWQGLRQGWQSLKQRAAQGLASLRKGWDWLKGKASDAWQKLWGAIGSLRGRAGTALTHAEGDACEFKVAVGESRSLATATIDAPSLPANAPAVMLKTEAGATPGQARPAALAARLAQGAGNQLDGPLRTRMESAFGTDLSGVRVHTDSRAAEMAGSLGARAFTVGRQIAFSAGEYRPNTVIGDALIAHEVAHVLQQHSAGAAPGHGDGGHRDGAPAGAGLAANRIEAGEDSAAELDADHSAVRAVSRMWLGLGAAGGRAEGWLSQAMPRLRTGLRLRRCAKSPEQCCEKGATAVASGALAPVPAGHNCEPTGDTRENVFSHQKLKEATDRPSIYGHTEIAKPPSDVFAFIDKGNAKTAGKCADKCKPALPGNVPSLRLSLFIFTKAGRYPEGTRKVKSGKCAGKRLPHFERISPKLADRIRAAEVEHCRDHSRAWDLTYGRYLAAVLELKDGFCPDPATPGKNPAERCAADYERRLRERSGYATAGSAHAAFDCLTNQTLDRDTSKSHTIKGKSTVEPNKDCTEVDLVVPDANALPEVGKKSAAELLKDSEGACGVPGAK